jgi:alpha-tubulin suppressor-like RCC1 family protein
MNNSYNVVLFFILIGFLGVGCDGSEPKPVVSKWTPLEIFSSCNKVAIGGSQVLVATDAGELYAWGFNYTFVLGDPELKHQYIPVKIKSINDVKCVAAGDNHSVVVKNDGTVWQWGKFAKEKGKPDIVYKTPNQVKNISGAIGISADYDSTLVLTESDGVYSWGSNKEGELGRGSVSHYEEPGVIPNSQKFVFIEAGGSRSYAIDASGALWFWGWKVIETQGDVTGLPNRIPIKSKEISNAVKVSDVNSHVSLLKRNGKVLTWGVNINGDLGTVKPEKHIIVPTQIAYDGLAVDISGRQLLSDNHEIWRWGLQYYDVGGIRVTRYPYENTPTKLYDDSAGQQIFSGGGPRGLVGISIDKNGCLESWGYTNSGQRGDGSRNFQKLFFNDKRVKLKYKSIKAGGKALCIQMEMNDE